ncbi:oligosaccharide flippase family protein [Calidifontibacillus erzurumensis]|uniref:Oligosaccharide flippase family protein n=1 Tax=Calidifontibacillus erzurumensis TaxID=2741433 RepID=A0A8J8GFJ9_9BACI|nr:oligosaccharide flippase family protein [Calidifontibacillus erzurumensis]NSL52727.1 oligosaccharide flippase family protein [Calidifontibacillus erzurumensis]
MSQLKAGAILSYVSTFITIGIALLYTPIMIRLLGQSEYGLYAMIGSISAYLSIMDLGLGNAIVRYVARNRAIGDKESEARLNGMFLFLYSIIGVLTILVGVVLYHTVQKIFGESLTAAELEKAKLMVVILIINFALSFPLSIFGSIMQAYERFIVVKVASIVRHLLNPLLTLPLLYWGYGAVMMVLVTTVINISILFYNVFYCFKYIKIKIHFGKLDFQLLKEILGYSFFIFLGIIVDQINWNTGQIILGAVSGTMVVAVFAIALQFVKLYLTFSTAISGLFLPKVSMMVAKNASHEDFTKLMIKFGRIQYIILSFILYGFILFGRPFIELWAGKNYSSAYYMVLIIMIPITIPLIQNLGLSILQAKNLQGFRSVVLILIAVFNVIISIPLAKLYGGIGVAIGTGASYLIGNAIVMNFYYFYRIGINIPLFWKNILKMSIPAFFSLVGGFLLNIFIPQVSILMLILKIILFSIIYFTFMWFFGFNSYEKGLLLPILKKLKIIRVIKPNGSIS